MKLLDYFGITAIIVTCTTVLGWWLKSRLDSSIKHEYDKILESFKAELKRSDVLLTERLAVFKTLSSHLLAMRRYCNARSAEFRNESEFESRTESLTEQENISLLRHHENLTRSLESNELLISPNSRQSFEQLFLQMVMGFNLELWLTSKDPDPEIVSSAYELYDLVSLRVNDVLGALYSDLGLPQDLTFHSERTVRKPT
jgi:hypothetical protein